MNKRGQVAKTVSTFFVMIGVLIIIFVFVGIASSIGKPNLISSSSGVVENTLLDKTIVVNVDDKVDKVIVLEGLSKYPADNKAEASSYGYKKEFEKALVKLVDDYNSGSKDSACLAYSVETDKEKRRIVISKSVGKNAEAVVDDVRFESPDNGVKKDEAGNTFKLLLKSSLSLDLENVPKISLDKNLNIYYYYGKCGGSK